MCIYGIHRAFNVSHKLHVCMYVCMYLANYYKYIVAPPKFIMEPRDEIIDLKQSAILKCSATGYGVGYQWKIGSGSFPSKVNDTSSATLMIPDVRSSDNNTYICEASNVNGSISSACTLTVTGMT